MEKLTNLLCLLTSDQNTLSIYITATFEIKKLHSWLQKVREKIHFIMSKYVITRWCESSQPANAI